MRKLRPALALLLATLLLAGLMAPATAAEMANFTDVQESDWFYDAVKSCTEEGLFEGTSETTFSPDGPMTRGMFVTVLGRFAGAQTQYLGTGTFTDVDSSEYYAPYVEWAAYHKLVEGVGPGVFGPEAPITRQEAASILYRFSDKDIPWGSLLSEIYIDGDQIAEYAEIAMYWAVRNGILQGHNELLRPRDPITRAEVAQIFVNVGDSSVLFEGMYLFNIDAAEVESITVRNGLHGGVAVLEGSVARAEIENLSWVIYTAAHQSEETSGWSYSIRVSRTEGEDIHVVIKNPREIEIDGMCLTTEHEGMLDGLCSYVPDVAIDLPVDEIASLTLTDTQTGEQVKLEERDEIETLRVLLREFSYKESSLEKPTEWRYAIEIEYVDWKVFPAASPDDDSEDGYIPYYMICIQGDRAYYYGSTYTAAEPGYFDALGAYFE